ncbi:MAG TPA: hypothetical protein VJ937_01575 [Salinivirga sp.]|uniref:hypothetical protein n=1 Tax=Salinivirga sp. TaxID=1970192 RepID=UPI002B48CD87|nr:hypothetical protein [Salinivirga sp.]HKK58142.1 hypothetical protein [Salinivirga sp.]
MENKRKYTLEKWYEVDDSYYDNPTDYEKLGYQQGDVNMLNYDQWLYQENYLFDYKGRIVRKFDYHIAHWCDYTNEPFDNGVSFVMDDHKKDFLDRKYALVDIYGNLLTKFFDDVGEGWIDSTYIMVQKNGKWGYIDKRGRQVTDFRFDVPGMDYEWLNLSHNYEIVRLEMEPEGVYKFGLFAFTGVLVLEPKYKNIEIKSDYHWFENNHERIGAMLNDEIIVTDFDDQMYQWTHRYGLRKVQRNP